MTHSEEKHPRDAAGKFSEKSHSAAEVTLPAVPDYSGAMTEERRRANMDAGGGYWTPEEEARISEPVHTCRSCGNGVDAYSIFPGTLCFVCYEKTAMQGPAQTSTDVARMWGA